MTEQFAVDCSFRNSATVYGKISTVLASGESMNDFGKMLLAHSRLAGDEYTQIGAGYLHCYLYSSIQQRTGTNDTESLLDG